MLKAVVFDMDGLLVDTLPYWAQARHALTSRYGYSWTEADQRAVDGVNTREWSNYIRSRLNEQLTADQIQREVVDRLIELYRARIPFMPGAVQAVQLAASRFPVGLASGSPPELIEIVTQLAGLRGAFQALVSADEVQTGKPAPDVYLEAIRRLGVEPQHAVCVEDSANGILAGRRAGLRAIAVPIAITSLTTTERARADLVLNSLLEFSVETLARLDGNPAA